MTMTEATTRTLDVPGATLTYDVLSNDSSTEPPLILIGSPMGAAGFGSLIKHFTDRTIVMYDPRGSERSTKPDMTSQSTPDEHADDVHRIIQEIGGGPVDLFATSGGVPERPRRLHGWRVRPAGRAGRLRDQAARGARREGGAGQQTGDLAQPVISLGRR